MVEHNYNLPFFKNILLTSISGLTFSSWGISDEVLVAVFSVLLSCDVSGEGTGGVADEVPVFSLSLCDVSGAKTGGVADVVPVFSISLCDVSGAKTGGVADVLSVSSLEINLLFQN